MLWCNALLSDSHFGELARFEACARQDPINVRTMYESATNELNHVNIGGWIVNPHPIVIEIGFIPE